MKLDKKIIELFEYWRDTVGKYEDLDFNEIELKDISIFENENITLIGSKKVGNHDIIKNINDSTGIPVYDASPNILTLINKDKYLSKVFKVDDNNNPDISFANEGNSSAGTNFIIHHNEYFANNHRTVMKFTNEVYSKYVYFKIVNMKKEYGFKRGYIPSQTNLKKLQIKIPIPNKPDDKKYTSFKLQQIITEFIEYYEEKITLYETVYKDLEETLNHLEYTIMNYFFDNKKDKVLVKWMNEYFRKHNIELDFEKIKFEDKRLQDLVSIPIRAGGTPPTDVKEYWNDHLNLVDDRHYFGWRNIDKNLFDKKYLYEYSKSITKDGLDNSSAWLIPANSILIAIASASKGLTTIIKKEMCVNQNILAVKLDENNYNTEYVYYYLSFFYETIGGKKEYGNLTKGSESKREVPLPYYEKKESKEIQDKKVESIMIQKILVKFLDDWYNWKNDMISMKDEMTRLSKIGKDVLLRDVFKGNDETN